MRDLDLTGNVKVVINDETGEILADISRDSYEFADLDENSEPILGWGNTFPNCIVFSEDSLDQDILDDLQEDCPDIANNDDFSIKRMEICCFILEKDE